MDSIVKLDVEIKDVFYDIRLYRRLVGKLIYLTVTCPNITFTVEVISQFIHAPRKTHWEAAYRILRYLKKAPRKGLLYCSSQCCEKLA